MSRIVLFDTTLRDGQQRAGISYSVIDKIKIAHRLDEFGIQYIEGGWPGSNPKDAEFFRAVRRERFRQARIVAFGSTRRGGVTPEQDANLQMLVEAGTQAVSIFGKSWDFHVTGALGVTLAENLAMIEESVAYLKRQGKEVIYDAEHFFDGYKHNRAYALATVAAAEAGGADYLTLCDTNGGTLPDELAGIIADVRSRTKTPLGIHAHDDSGVGVANSLVAVREGCVMVQGTMNGYGERCGNANLVAIIPNLQLKLGRSCLPPENLKRLTEVSHLISELANLIPWDAQPYVGRNAFSHKGGIHVSAVLKNPAMYEHINPEAVGNTRNVVVSELSGRSNVVALNQDGKLDLGDAEASEVVQLVKELEHQGYQFEGAEASLELLLKQRQRGYKKPFLLEGFRVTVDQRHGDQAVVEATVKARVGEQRLHTAGEGNGPVNALDNALRKGLGAVFPALAQVRLLDYKVRVLEGSDGTGAKVRVLIESGDGKNTWGTVGVSENIIEASWQALADALEYGLLLAARQSGEDEAAG